MTKTQSEHETAPVYAARDVRQGDIVLRKPWERRVFIAGLVGAVVVALALVFVGVHFGQAYREQHARGHPAQVGMIKS
jgi:small basic protein